MALYDGIQSWPIIRTTGRFALLFGNSADLVLVPFFGSFGLSSFVFMSCFTAKKDLEQGLVMEWAISMGLINS